jgi:hypothetical protein
MASRWRYDFVCHALRNIMGCRDGQDIGLAGSLDRHIWRRPTGAQPDRLWKEGAMLSTTVDPECRQRPLVTSYAMTESRSGEGAAADQAPQREAANVLAHAAIHPRADRVAAYGTIARANSPAVH